MTDPGADDGFSGDTPSPRANHATPVGKISLREQADEAQSELARRHRSYSGMVKHGSMTEAEKAVGIARQTAIRDTLRLLAEHEDAVRETLAREITAAKAANEQAAKAANVPSDLESIPAVAAIRDVFPEATVASVRPLEPAA